MTDNTIRVRADITDAFTKYAMVTAVENKEAETVAKAIQNGFYRKRYFNKKLKT